jgi:NTE family protein
VSTIETATDYGLKEYLPLPKGQRRGKALALSGGGYRAALFDLGALRRLNELGVLTRLDTITSVSGGSVASAQLARHRLEHPEDWKAKRPIARFEEEIAEPLRECARHDIRTRAVLARFYPWNWFRAGISIDELAQRLIDGPAGHHALSKLKDDPSFVFCATELRFRTQWQFDTGKGRIGSELAGFTPISSYWTLARSAAASAAFPFAFPPVRVPPEARPPGTYTGPDRDELVRRLQLTDGGLYDNMGLEPVWRDHEAVLVSDASPTFKYAPAVFGLAWSGLRYAVTLLEQTTDVRKRWLISSFLRGDLAGTYWGIGSLPGHYGHDSEPKAYSDDFVADYISQVRIDFDAFSDGEICVLENHGYLLAEIAMRTHAKELVEGPWPEPQVPHPDWMDEGRARRALAESAKTKLFARYR